MIKSCLSINISVTFILSAAPGASFDSQFNILIKFSLSPSRNKLSDVEFLWFQNIEVEGKFNCESSWSLLATVNINQLFPGVFLYFSVYTFPPQCGPLWWHTPHHTSPHLTPDGPWNMCHPVSPSVSANKPSTCHKITRQLLMIKL